jgi:hypothetical protein
MYEAKGFEPPRGDHPRAGAVVNRARLFAVSALRLLSLAHSSTSRVVRRFTGGIDCNDHTRIWDTLDKVRVKHPDMVLIHGGSPKGAEKIASL